ncbi:hypothetical protein ISF_02602 [Cordyceps fumosorosea ARSEF 2679]|uniref:Uncharacterized protein n=1 Tax=Cordyceps fumosorosea (strain ARSEF 2679) TaxID=1081104 RepID=A0A168BWA0_CORFA|nr:hypothetical protein ISF_02602 [Cordyceps fumosorosea ARSEF 2679]OAA70628.1 hypothetical protein ISF_02602 [Cordyceps fumosorosea ARSEF 2679]
MDRTSTTQLLATATVSNLPNLVTEEISSTRFPAEAVAMPATLSVWRDERTGQTYNAPLDNLDGLARAADGSTLAPGDGGNLGPFQVLIPVSAVGWVLFGAGCILAINGKGRAGRWVPEWYLDSDGTRRDRALVAAWWLAVLLLWPVILPALLLGKVVRGVRRALDKRARRGRQRKARRDEESRMAQKNQELDASSTQ